jgi:hypothetical protein
VDFQTNSSPTGMTQDDAILPATRLVAAGVIPFLLVAFVVLYFLPGETGRWFAWEIASPLTTALMGAGYLGGAFFFACLLMETRWHRVGGGFLPVAVFTAVMLAATLLHWDTFDPTHWVFLVWLAIYILTPVVVPLVWWRNRPRDPGAPEAGDSLVPTWIRILLLLVGIGLVGASAFLFLQPETAITVWPWPLTPLTARVVAGWHLLMGTGALVLAPDRRWSAWRLPLSSILLWQFLLLLAFAWRQDAFGPAGPVNWYTVFTLTGFIAAAALSLYMERSRPQNPRP